MNITLKRLLRPTISISLLTLALAWVGPQKLWESISNLHPFAVAGVLVLSSLNIASTNVRFCLLLKKLGGTTPFWDAYKANSKGQASAIFFIPLLAQVAARQHAIEKSGLPQISNIIIAMIERLSTAVLSLTTALFGLWYLFGMSEAKNILASASLAEIVLTISISTAAYLISSVSIREKQHLKLLLNFKTLKSALPVIALTLASYSFIVSCFLLAIKLTKPQLNVVDSVAASAIISFAASIPISIGGWGLREFAAIFFLKHIGVDEASALTISLSVGALSTLATLLNAAACLLMKPKLIMPPAESPLRPGKHSLTRISAYLLGATTAAFVLFQMKASFGSNALSLNLADPFAVLSFAAVFVPILTHRELPKWESRTFNLSIALFGVALVVAFIVGYLKIGVTAWALAGRLTGYIVVLGYLGAGYLVAHQFGRRGFVTVSRILGITASGIVLTQMLLKSVNLDFLPHSVNPAFEGFSANRNAFSFQLIIITCLLLPQFKAHVQTPKSNAIFTTTLGVCGAGVFLSGSRTGMLVLAIIYGTSLLLRISPIGQSIKSIALSFAIGLPFYLAQWAPQWAPQWSSQWSSQSSDHLRFQANTIALQNWFQNPIFGSGLGTFIADSERLLGLKMMVHNSPLWILAEFGLFGFSLFLFMAWTVSRHLLKVKAWQGTPQQKALMLTLIAFGLFCELHEILYQRIFWLAIGITLAAANRKLKSKPAFHGDAHPNTGTLNQVPESSHA